MANKKLDDAFANHNLSWDLLFGDADFCECGECTSVYSAAAYYVELLQYLRNNNLDNQTTINVAGGSSEKKYNFSKDYKQTPLGNLLARRPDLGCLELTCANTNTILPYIDLVNEVMESYIVHSKTTPYNVADETTGELLAQPQHTEYQAYCILKSEVYPFTLPYHQPIDAARISLDFLNTSRYEVIDTFRKNNAGSDITLTKLQDEALDRAADAEFLGMTKEEYIIITQECFESKALMDKRHNKIFTVKEYQDKIGKKETWQYYGLSNETDLLALKQIKPNFLTRTGIDYVTLVDLLKTEYINPDMPTGKSRAIMESLRSSYQAMNIWKTFFGLESLANQQAFYEFWADFITTIQDLNKVCENPSTPLPQKIEQEEIKKWIKCNFERVGKMIVIESGKECVNGKIYRIGIPETKGQENLIEISSIIDCEIISKNPEDVSKPPKIIGKVDKNDGKITLYTDDSNEIESLPETIFISSTGEKSIFTLNDNGVFLLLSSKDTCNLDTAQLQHLDGLPLEVEEFDRIHRFIRLKNKLGWTIDETDKAIVGLNKAQESLNEGITPFVDGICEDCGEDCGQGNCGCDDCSDVKANRVFHLNPELIHQLVAVKKLVDLSGLELIKLLSFWTEISTAGEKSLYKRLFLTHNVQGIDKVFKADPNGNFLTSNAKFSEHKPVLMAALNLSTDDMDAIRKDAKITDDSLTIQVVSTLYRYRLLSKVLGLKIPAFISILPLFGDVFHDAHTTLEFMERWAKMEDAGFSYQQLNYIIKNINDERKPLAPSQKTVLVLAKTLYDGLNAIDEAHKDLVADNNAINDEINRQEKATSDLIRTKASLLFDSVTVEKIIGFLEGTLVFTAKQITKNLTIKFPIYEDVEKTKPKSLNSKLKYDKTNGVVQITGILTLAEENDFNALSVDATWLKALVRLKNQQAKLLNELFSGIIAKEKLKSSERSIKIDILAQMFNHADVAIPLDKITDRTPDPNTAPKKRLAFLEIFLPYLRQELTHRFVIDTLANAVSLDKKVVDILISKILLQDGNPIYSIFEKIKESTKPVVTGSQSWSGYLIPSANADYTFIFRSGANQPILVIDEKVITDFTKVEDDENGTEWWSETITLEAGKLYHLSLNADLKDVYWKTITSAITLVPISLLIPDFTSKQCEPALISLKKTAILVSVFNLSADEIAFLDMHKDDYKVKIHSYKTEKSLDLDLNSIYLEHWLRLDAYTRLRNSLPKEAKINTLDFWAWMKIVPTAEAEKTTKESDIPKKIEELTLWKADRIGKLIADKHFNIKTLADFRNEENLLKLQKALTVADKIGVDIDLLFDWAVPTSKFNTCRTIADSIANAIRARYNQTDWEQVVKPLNDKLRNNQRDALLAYLLQRPKIQEFGVTDADGLFEFFLIDVQMDACMQTSRIKQAISSVQTFIQRCFLGLEEKKNDAGEEKGVPNDLLDRGRWDWMSRYRVWEANRKVYLYPENWIESNLRDDKSPFYKELESELLQKDINKQNVTDALKNYLYKVDEVANMEVVGLYIEYLKKEDGTDSANMKKLHVFSRTRNAPYFFYYRYLDIKEGNWYPWEKMQVDIPSYDATDENGNITGNGCYLTPVVWNGRLLIFFPQIMKKTKPSEAAEVKGKTIALIGNGATQDQMKPIEYYEIKMAWSEYRNGKWTQKQLSKDAIYTKSIDTTHDIPYFKFIPQKLQDKVNIFSDDFRDNDGGFYPPFAFDGNHLKLDKVSVITENIPIDFFNQTSEKKIYSWQLSGAENPQRLNKELVFINTETTTFNVSGGTDATFYHPNTHDLLGKINTAELKDFFGYNLTDIRDKLIPFNANRDSVIKNDAFGNYGSRDSLPLYHELKRPYSIYNWELFFHTPLLLADALSKSQQFEEAMKWYHFVFDPLANFNEALDKNSNTRYWQFRPFKEVDSQSILEKIFNSLKPNEANKDINEWRNKPFMPHVVARSRPVAYMKWVVMKYIDNLVAWGDYLFRQDTIESINQATQLYILAGHILGPRPMMIPKRGKTKVHTYLSLLNKWDAMGDAMAEVEIAIPFSNQSIFPYKEIEEGKEIQFANIFGFSSARYFCIPNNPKLMGYWDTIGDRLFKIRHCENIEGIFRMLPLFEPPIDPALLVRAAANGLSIASVLNDLNTPMPNYRFYYLLQKALELCGELKSLGGALLSAIEKKDNESLSLIRAKHESSMHNLVMEIKKLQVEEAQMTIDSLHQNRKSPEARMGYYLKLSGLPENLIPSEDAEFNGIPNDIATVDGDSGLKLISFEKEDMEKASAAADWQTGIGIVETLGSILNLYPQASVDGKPLGVGAGVTWGGINLGNALQATARGLQVYSTHLSYQSSNSGKKGGFKRALQDRVFQANSAGYEIKQIDKQVLSQKIRINISNQEITNQQKQIDNTSEIEAFLKDKYSNEELYDWMKGNLKTLYHQVYSLAYDLAKKAEKTYRFERGLSSSNFIQGGYFDAGRDGLLAGEKLFVGLKQLEAAYQENRGYDYEITKHVSLRQINPLALFELRANGKGEFILPEVLFDMDYPGQYKRRIKSVSISIPCIAGPYTGVNASLRLLENKFRNTAVGGKNYQENTEETDERFNTFVIPISAISASTAQNDSGMFELNFKDERYLPFEGAGVISKWRLELPEFRQFDYNTISDVVVHIRYTSAEGGERLKTDAVKSVNTFMSTTEDVVEREGLFMVVDLKHDLPTEWHKALIPVEGTMKPMDLSKISQFLPFYSTLYKTPTVKNVICKFDEMIRTIENADLLAAINLTLLESDKNTKQAFMVVQFAIKK